MEPLATIGESLSRHYDFKQIHFILLDNTFFFFLIANGL